LDTEERLCRHPDARAFVAAAAADPDDDGPRLVFADWLDDHGDHTRAEFIRLSCRLARSDPAEPPPLRSRLEQLVREHGQRWLRGVPLLPGVTWGFRRGLPGFVRVANWGTFRQHAPALFRSAPVEAVEFGNLSARGAGALAESALLPRLRELDLSWFAVEGPAELRILLAAPAIAGLHTLALHKNGLGDAGARLIATSPHLTGLRVLRLDACDIGPAGGLALATSPYLRDLQLLEIARNPLGDEAEDALRLRWGVRARL
jgi:uncharacterized protein (TIGR02996 family)